MRAAAVALAACAPVIHPAPRGTPSVPAAWRAALALPEHALLDGIEVVVLARGATDARIATVTPQWIVATDVPVARLAPLPPDPVQTHPGVYDFKGDVIESDDPRFDQTLGIPANACLHDAADGAVVGMALVVVPVPTHVRDGWQGVRLHTAWGERTYFVRGPLDDAPWMHDAK